MQLIKSVVLEGPDGSGKTTLMRNLVRQGFRSSGHDGNRPKDAAEAWKRLAEFAALGPCLRDRTFVISDWVYNEVFKRDPIIPEWERLAWLALFRPTVIYCRPSVDTILAAPVPERPHKSPDWVEEVKANRRYIIDAYDREIAYIKSPTIDLPVLHFNYVKDDVKSVLGWLQLNGLADD